MDTSRLSELPVEMLSFTILSAAARATPRIGRLSVPQRKAILTPGFVATTSRGIIPHIAPDVQAKHTHIPGVYLPIEDFLDKAPKQTPPIYNIPPLPNLSRLRRFTTQPDDTLLILGLRRPIPVDAPLTNSNEAFTIYTSVGFRHEKVDDYIEAATVLQPDIFIAPADVVYTTTRSIKRTEKILDRSSTWLDRTLRAQTDAETDTPFPPIFAPILPIAPEQQQLYLSDLTNHSNISGLAIYDPIALPGIPDSLASLPRFSLFPPSSPHTILSHINAGIDIFTIPFIGEASDAGLALSFSFPPPSPSSNSTTPEPLAIDLALPIHNTSLEPLSPNCDCHACDTCTRAYMQHLLSAKEMLGWTFLQLHNHAIMHRFFAGIRASIKAGTWEADVIAFNELYEAELPAKTGAGPRIRGYQYRSGPGEKKRNGKGYGNLDRVAVAGAEVGGGLGAELAEAVEQQDVVMETAVDVPGDKIEESG
ncbi:tRNA-guanine transglycosylase [Microthyrium microscopicum]|uniref:Queuine tRNA-ribosyltransferase accessory subunit 2 n=1 Tax=Microthyrium microscopicum TaxID=703497 RepID=A0A6A6U2G0_9PEZI|nr:tRNA-guanine transglycosylase [Microthyrium microscopicum]